MARENAIWENKEDLNEDWLSEEEASFNFDELEAKLQDQLEEGLGELEFLKEEKEKIGNPDELGKVILDEIWNQFGNQIGLDMTNETTIQKYNRQHLELYDDVGKDVMKDEKYKEANKKMKEQQQSGELTDAYTGKKLSENKKVNLDHVVSRKELYDNDRRKQANLSVEELANKSENLQATNESLNKSKGKKKVDDYLNKREVREQELKRKNEAKNKKINNDPNLSELEKQLKINKNDGRLQDKLDADDKLMKKADKQARKAINKDITKGAVKEVRNKAGKDALKQMAIAGLFTMLKEIMNGLIRFLKSQAKSFKVFLGEMKQAIKSFLDKIASLFLVGASSIVGTILSELFGPIVSTFKSLASVIKQGVFSVGDAMMYLKDKKNRNQPFSVKVAQVGKIVTAGLVAVGAISGGEVFEKILLLYVPGMQVQLPLIGSLANIIGMFLASVISGVIGAIIMNQIDKYIAKQQRADIVATQIDNNNKILNTQRQIRMINEERLEIVKEMTLNKIKERNDVANDIMGESFENIAEKNKSIESTFENMDRLLAKLKKTE